MLYGFRRAPKDARVLFVKKAWYTKPKFVRSLAVGALAFAIGVGSFLMPEAHAYTADAFVMVVKTDNPGTSSATSFTIPITGAGYSYNVDCNDDGVNEVTARTTSYTCVYGAAGTYTVAITGTFPRIFFNNTGDREKLLEVKQWGNIAWTSMASAFYGCSNMHVTATDAPNLAGVTNMSGMFREATSFNENINNWNTSTITDMSYLFAGFYGRETLFNQPLDNWNTVNVTNMGHMFWNNLAFNQPIGSWNTSKVTDMSFMLAGGTQDTLSIFNQPIGTWDTSAVTTMSEMFDYNAAFNQPLATWNTGSVTNMRYMFMNAEAFNQPIGNWNTSAVTYMNGMFMSSAFNQPINGWDTSKVTDMGYMFNDTFFNQDISGWNVGKVTNMSGMFMSAPAFNQSLAGWNTSSVTDMSYLFCQSPFNQSVGLWDTHNVTNMSYMFSNNKAFTQPLNSWDISKVTNMSGMFSGASAFNQPITTWNISAVTDMSNMLDYSGMSTASYDQTLADWANRIVQPNVKLGAVNIGFTNYAAHDILTSPPNNWTITDPGYNTPIITSPNSSSTITSFKPLITGTTIPNRAVTITLDGTNFTTSSQTDGSFAYQVINELSYGDHLLTVRSSDQNGIPTTPQKLTFTIQNSPTVSSPTNLEVVPTATPTIVGTAVANHTVQLSLDGTDYTTIAHADGSFSYQVVATLVDGWHVATMSTKDFAGNPGTPTQLSFYVHTGGNITINGAPQTPTLSWSAAPPTPAGSLWTEATVNAPWSARSEHSTVVFNNKLWVMGGYANGTNYNDVWSSPDGVTWTEATSSAPWSARSGHTTTVFNNKLWIFGGGNAGDSYNDVWSSPDGVNWTEVTASAPWPARWGHTTVIFNNKLWVMGGYGNGTEYNDVWSSQDGVTWTQVTANAAWPARDSYAAAAFNGKLWVIGGCATTCNPDGDVWSSPDGVTWTQATPEPLRATTRTSYAQPMAQVFDGKLWLIGGYGENWDYTSDVWYTEDGTHWSLATDKPGWSSRSDHTTAVFNDKLWLIGGVDDGVGNRNDVWSTSLGKVTYTICWDTVENGCAQTAQTTNSSFTIPSNLAKGTWHFKVTANIPGTQGTANYTTAAYTVTDPLPVITPLTGKPVIHPVTGAASTVTLAPTLAEASLSVSSYDCSDVKAPTVRLVEPDGLKVPEANVTLLGGVGFSVGCTGTGKSADVALSFGAVYADTTKLRAYKGTGATLTDITDKVTFVTKDVSGTTRTVLSYTLTDGGSFDEDSIANSTIVDPIYIGVVQGASATAPVATTAAGGSLANTGVSVGMVAVGGAFLALVGVGVAFRLKRHRQRVTFSS